MADLVVAPCSYEAAKYAVMNWHYSKAMPSGKLVKFGVWECGQFVGSIIYGMGASQRLGDPYGLKQSEICELVRVAYSQHSSYVSASLARSLSVVHSTNPGMRMVISFADTAQSHYGGIYQASNWLYLGALTTTTSHYQIHGQPMHGRSVRAKYGSGALQFLKDNVDPNAKYLPTEPKHRYAYPLDKQMRRRLNKVALPYPKSADEGSTVIRATSGGEGRVQLSASAPNL